jgi:hypothetical protein
VTKYLTKPIDSNVLDFPSLAAEVVGSLHHRRLSMTFGSWRGLKLTSPPAPQLLAPVMSLRSCLHRAAEGDVRAVVLLTLLWGQKLGPTVHDRGSHQSLDSLQEAGEFYCHHPPDA